MNLENMKSKLHSLISEKRFIHTLGVVETAKKLAQLYEVDIEKAEIAALLHDCAKELPKEELKYICETYFSKEFLTFKDTPQIYHSFAGAYIAQNNFGIVDENILNSIKYHTTGNENLSPLEKIIYIADAIEPNRIYPAVEKIRELAFINLDEAILFEVDKKIEYLIHGKSLIHINTLMMRNSLLLKNK